MGIPLEKGSIRPVLLAAVVLVALVYAWGLAWVAEDAYISFRYARNLVEGQGLVFNPGERVEGYTNFLWTALLSAGLAVGGSPDNISLILGLVFSAGGMLAFSLIHRQTLPAAIFPAALLSLGLNYSWASFSTGGMETSLLAFLLILSYALLYGNSPASPLAGGALLALAVMTRPDAALAVVAPVADSLIRRKKPVFLLTFALLYAPYFLWRWSYYGELLPNTYYAKSAALTYHQQGLAYAAQFLGRHNLWVLLPAPLIAAFLVYRRKEPVPAVLLAAIVFMLLHSYYVIRIGGDFMEGRFFIPVLPFLYLLLEWSLRAWRLRPVWTAALLGLLVLTSAADRNRLPERTIVNGITDERTWQPVVQTWLLEGEVMGRHLPAGTMAATDAVGAFGWASRLQIIDTLGLTDRTIARLPVAQRARPGHEKAAPLEYLRNRNVALLRDGVGIYRNQLPDPDFIFAGNRYYLLSSDPSIGQGFRRAIEQLGAKR